MEERILDILFCGAKGLFGQKFYDLVITERRLIVSRTTNKELRDETKELNEKLKEQGVGALKRMGSMMTGQAALERYTGMAPEDIAAKNPENYSVNNADISVLKLKEKRDSQDRYSQVFTIKWSSGSDKFIFKNLDIKQTKESLREIFGKKVK